MFGNLLWLIGKGILKTGKVFSNTGLWLVRQSVCIKTGISKKDIMEIEERIMRNEHVINKRNTTWLISTLN